MLSFFSESLIIIIIMKNLKTTNFIAIGIPILLLVYGFIDETGFYLSAYSTMLTGFTQIIIGLIYWFKFKNDLNIKIYFSLVVLFFSLWYFNENIHYSDALTYPLLITPLLLCIYFSIIIHSKK